MQILLIEDEKRVADFICRGLKAEGFFCEQANDAATGLSFLKQHQYDLLIIDRMLPDMDGLQVLKSLASTARMPPVLLLTAKDRIEDRVSGLEAGADDYLTKPFDFDELLARLRALIRRNHGQAQNRIELGEVSIDLAARTLEQSGEPVPLTPREYALVEYLALHRGVVISRTELYEHLFDENDDTLSNLLDVHVSNVRKKLGAAFITPRRGHGYCIE